MPIHFEDLDIMPEVSGLKSALIVPCIMCPATTLAIRDKKPVMQIFRSLVTSAPLEQYIKDLQSRLIEKGLKTKVFKSYLYQQWFLCMRSAGLTNAKLKFKFPGNVCFEGVKIIPMPQQK